MHSGQRVSEQQVGSQRGLLQAWQAAVAAAAAALAAALVAGIAVRHAPARLLQELCEPRRLQQPRPGLASKASGMAAALLDAKALT